MLCIFFSTPHLCPCWILYPWCKYLCVFVAVMCWTCKWHFALSLLACMSGCSFHVWMIIVVTIYSDCSCLVKPCFIVIFFIYLIALCLLRMHFKISAYNDLLVLLFLGNLSIWFKSFTEFRVRCEWVLATVPNSHFKSRVCFRVLSQYSQRGRL